MEIQIKISDAEKQSVINAIAALNKVPHLKYMTQEMLSLEAGIKATKIRAILVELIKERKITQYAATENKNLKRYYYVIEPANKDTKLTLPQASSGGA